MRPSPIAASREARVAQPVGRAGEAELVRRLAAREPEALGLTYDRYAPSLYGVLHALLGSTADAEDALQEVFLKVATGRVAHVRDLRSYLFVTARHEALSQLRRRKREAPLDETTPPLMHAEAATGAGLDSGYDWPAMLARLPMEQREVIALKVWEQLTFAEIAPIVKASPNTVMSRYRYGIERLRAWCREVDADES